MNIFDIDPKQMDDMASEYLTGMYESRYDNEPTEKELELWEKEHRLDPRYLKPPLPEKINDDEIPF